MLTNAAFRGTSPRGEVLCPVGTALARIPPPSTSHLLLGPALSILRIQTKSKTVFAYAQDITVLQDTTPNYLTVNERPAMAFRHRARLQDHLTVRGTADNVDSPFRNAVPRSVRRLSQAN
jgi:hypothetical protein